MKAYERQGSGILTRGRAVFDIVANSLFQMPLLPNCCTNDAIRNAVPGEEVRRSRLPHFVVNGAGRVASISTGEAYRARVQPASRC